MRILVVEDEKILANTICELLKSKGYDAEAVYDGDTGKEYALLNIYDLIILDIMMPKMNGYDLAETVRAKKVGTPILMLTAKASTEDRIKGLNVGADYYLTKPFDTRELIACVNALLRRQDVQVNQISFGNTSLDLSTSILICGNNNIRLSAKEFDVMRLLLHYGEKNLPKESILTKVWGFESEVNENSVEVYIRFLRHKLASIGSNIKIVSIRRMGYHLEKGTP